MWNVKCEYLINMNNEQYFCEERQMFLETIRQCWACQKCAKCVNSKTFCNQCSDNFKYVNTPRTSYFQDYIPLCPRGFIDCSNDPAYILKYSPSWYKKTYGDKTPQEVLMMKGGCLDSMKNDPEMKYYCYDDEDK